MVAATRYGFAATPTLGTASVQKHKKVVESPENPFRMTTDDYDKILVTFRILIADLVQQYNGGHPGGAMGMAAIGVALWKHVLRISPSNPNFFNRDRFVLSNGHTCLFQYAFHHLVGYKHMTLDQLKSYHSAELDSYCPGHPENEHPGIEVTTGALGQGVANSVGLAIAAKNLQATYNRPEYPIVSNHTFCIVGDACLQEGISLEAISLAGHLCLDNLTIIYDNNQITCDGSVDLTNTENINEKFRACNWNVIEIMDGSEDVSAIVTALEASRKSDKPTLVNVQTKIGYGPNLEGTAAAHGAAFGQDEVDRLHSVNGFPVDKKIVVPQYMYDFFKKEENEEKQWNELLTKYQAAHPELAKEFLNRVNGKLPSNWESLVPTQFPSTPTASRKSSGLCVQNLAENIKSLFFGTADLSPSVNLSWKSKVDFQNPAIDTACGTNGDYLGRYLHYGIREHSMAGIANGIAAYNPGTFIPVTSSFFMFYLYAAPAVRYGALSKLKVIHVATHDSVGLGEDGPTHQPIALATFYRALPQINYIRPADSEETAGAWIAALKADTPTIISLSRHNLEQQITTNRQMVAKGAYLLQEDEDAQITIIGVGAELTFAVGASKVLRDKGIKSRVVSFPSQRLFEQQSLNYKRSVLKRGKVPCVVIEAYAPNGWERYATAGFNMTTFGKSLPGSIVYDYFGFNSAKIADRIERYIKEYEDPDIKFEFQDLLAV